eukprot:m.68289 g.68289  ORF g.68289 m.68289 type:complete len:441 (+) comp23941_c0_seq4:70-1392(+)
MLVVTAVLLIVTTCSATSHLDVASNMTLDEWYAPAYWEPQEAIYLLATTETSVDPIKIMGDGPKTPIEVQAMLAIALATSVNVRVLVSPASDEEMAFREQLRKLHYAGERVTFYNVTHCDIWTRDTGPIWIKQRTGHGVKMIKPIFSLWGYLVNASEVDGPWAKCDVPNLVPDQLQTLFKFDMETPKYTSEGGDKSFNGHGSVLMSKIVEMQRNPHLTLSELEDLAKKSLHVSHIVWVEQGVGDDEQSFRGPMPGINGTKLYTAIGTGGHVDEFTRFVGPSTVLLAQVSQRQREASPLAKLTGLRLDRDYELLKQQKDQDGNNLIVLRLPSPDELIIQMDRNDGTFSLLTQLPALGLDNTSIIDVVIAASYNNYVIANDVVVIPKYYKQGRSKSFEDTDREALEVMQKIFPTRKIVQVNPEPVNAGGGGLNCISNNMPLA